MSEGVVQRAALVRKLSEIIKEVGAVPKEGKNAFHGYSYRRHEDITNKLQPALAKHGIVIIPLTKKLVANEPGYVLLEVTYEVTDGEQSIKFQGIGEGMDRTKDGRPGDKAAYKAQTGAMKYALNDLLLLAGEDPEADKQTHPDGPAGNGKSQPQQKPQGQTGKQVPTEKPQAKAPAHTLTTDQETVLTDIMNEMKYDQKLKNLGLQKAQIEGFAVAKAKLEKLREDYRKKQPPKGGTA